MSFLSTLFTAAAIVAVDYFTLGAATAYQMAVTFAVSIVASRIFAPNVPQAQQNNIRQQVPPDPTAGIPLVYGDAYTGGRFCDAVLSQNQKQMFYVMVISNISPNGQFIYNLPTPGNPSNFYYQDQIITFDALYPAMVSTLTDGANNVTPFANQLYIYLYTSSPTGTITPINTTYMPWEIMKYDAGDENTCPSGQEWASTNRNMNGLAFAIVQLVYNQNAPGTTSLQPVTFYVSHYLNGAGCAKPGDVWYDYITNPIYGGAIDPSFVSSASGAALNAYSDELITYTPAGGGTASQARYRFNGVLDTGQTVLSNIDLMMTCCDSWQAYQAATGYWQVVINKAISPSFSFDDNNIVGSITVGELDITQMVNQIEAKFNDSTNRDQAGYVNLQTPANLIYQNEPVNKFTVSYDLINNSVTAQYLANRTLEQNRLDLIVSFSTNYTGIQVNAGDVVTVTNSSYGWTNQQFRVMQVKESSLPDGSLGAAVQLIAYDANVYATGDITQYHPTPNSGLASPTYFSALAAPTISAHHESATQPNFDVQVYIPLVGRVTTGTLFYTTVSTPSPSDWSTWLTATTSNNQQVPNNTYFTFADVVLPAATYYFAYTVGNDKTSTLLSPISTAFVWTPVGLSGASGASGASGYSGFSGLSGMSGYSGLSGYSGVQGNSFREAYYTQSQSLSAPSVSPNPTTGSTSFPTSVAWSGSITTPAAGQSLWAIDGTYNPNTNQTSWSAPYLTQGFPTTIQSDNYVLNTSGWQIQRDTGNAYFNAISARGDISGGSNINITGQGIFNGATAVGSNTFSLIANQANGAYGGILAYSQNSGSSLSFPFAAVVGQATYNNVAGAFTSAANSAIVASSTGTYPTIAANAQGSGAIGVSGYSVYGTGVYGSGSTNGVYSAGPFGTSSTAFVNNLYAQYAVNLVGQRSGTLLYFQTGPTTGASTATFNPANKPGTTSGSNTWIEVIINGSSYQIPVWAS